MIFNSTSFIFLILVILFNGCQSKADTHVCIHDTVNLFDISSHLTLKDAQECSKSNGNPILLIFDIPVVGSSRKSSQLFSNSLKRKSENFNVMYLQLDDKTKLDKPISRTMKDGSKSIQHTVGDKHLFTMIDMFNMVSTPYYALLDKNLKLVKPPRGYFSNEAEVNAFLEEI